jgi:hypothetical protein
LNGVKEGARGANHGRGSHLDIGAVGGEGERLGAGDG